MNTNAHLIANNGETRGTIFYTSRFGVLVSKKGNFQIHTDGKTIIARNIGGRNRWNFITVDQVIDFVPFVKAGE